MALPFISSITSGVKLVSSILKKLTVIKPVSPSTSLPAAVQKAIGPSLSLSGVKVSVPSITYSAGIGSKTIVPAYSVKQTVTTSGINPGTSSKKSLSSKLKQVVVEGAVQGVLAATVPSIGGLIGSYAAGQQVSTALEENPAIASLIGFGNYTTPKYVPSTSDVVGIGDAQNTEKGFFDVSLSDIGEGLKWGLIGVAAIILLPEITRTVRKVL